MLRRLSTGRISRRATTLFVPIAHQRRVREAEAARDPRPTMATLDGSMSEVTFAEAKAVIVRYEWLEHHARHARACYELRAPEGELAASQRSPLVHRPKAATSAGVSIATCGLPRARRVRSLAPAQRGLVPDLARLQAGPSGIRLANFLRLC